MTKLLQLPALLEAAGVNVRTLDGWDKPHIINRRPYVYRTADGEPVASKHHHTATTKYTPNRQKACGYLGLSYKGSERLYQERYLEFGYRAVYTIANAYPAPISSGAGDRNVMNRLMDGDEILGRQGPDTPGWYGNTYYWNDEYVLNGIGAPLDPEVFEMAVVISQVKNKLMGWTELNHIGHGHHTRRKIDLWDATWSDTNRDGFDKTIIALRAAIVGGTPVLPPSFPPPEGDEYMFPMLREGDGYENGPNPHYIAAVKAEQIMLDYHGYTDPFTTDPKCKADGARGPGTTGKCSEFQTAKGLVSDGICGPITWDAYNEMKA